MLSGKLASKSFKSLIMTSMFDSEQIKVIFLGNHDVGIKSIQGILNSKLNLIGIVAHPICQEEGSVFKSVFEFAKLKEIPAIRGEGKSKKVFKFIQNLQPDLIWITDYKYIIPESIINLPPMGVINLHPSLLPNYRGRAPLNWAIINGEKHVGLTAHYVDGGVDTGPIIKQYSLEVGEEDYIGDVLENLYPLYEKLTCEVLDLLKTKSIEAVVQEKLIDKPYARRKAEDGLINWKQNPVEILRLIKALSKPYPGAFFYENGTKYVIWRAYIEKDETTEIDISPGIILNKNKNNLKIKLISHLLIVTVWDEFEVKV